MKRIISKSLIDLAKSELGDSIVSRITKEVNENQCWHLKSVDGSKIVDAVCHFRDGGKKRIFFKAKRLVFELIKGDLPEGFAIYSSCKNKYCVNPEHHYATTPHDYIGILKLFGLFKARKGFKHRPETIKKMSQKHKGRKPSDQSRYKMSLAKIGVKRNPKVVAKMSYNSRGENNGCSKLTEKQVLKIRSLRNSISSEELSKIYPVSASHIRRYMEKRLLGAHIGEQNFIFVCHFNFLYYCCTSRKFWQSKHK